MRVINSKKHHYDDGILKQHNEVVCGKIFDAFESGQNRVWIQQATGTGKSYVTTKVVKDLANNAYRPVGVRKRARLMKDANGRSEKRVLFVAPKTFLCSDFEEMVAKVGKKFGKVKRKIDLNVSTYQSLHKHAEEDYDMIIFDEMHRLGAEKWGQSAETLVKNNPDAKVLGLTATPERGDGVDITQKVFDGADPVSTLTIEEAIARGILPPPNYVLAQYNFEQYNELFETNRADLEKRKEKASKEEKAEIQALIDQIKAAQAKIAQAKGLPQIFEEALNTDKLKNGKYIIFCPSSRVEDKAEGESEKSCKYMEAFMKKAETEWFKGVTGGKPPKIYGVHSNYGRKHNDQALKDFENDKSDGLKLMFSVDLINEGKHIDDIDGVIMLRPTGSEIVYMQQLGRALSVGHNPNPLILDVVGNLTYSNFTQILDIKTKVDELQGNLQDENQEEPTNIFDRIKQIEEEQKRKQSQEKDPNKSKKKKTQQNHEFTLNTINISVTEFLEQVKSNIQNFQEEIPFEEIKSHLIQYLKENPKHKGSIPDGVRTKDGYLIGRRIYNLAIIRKGKVKSRMYNEKHFKEIDKILPGWDKYQKKEFNFDRFYEELKAYVAQRHAFYDAIGNVPMELRYLRPPTAGKKEEGASSLGYKWGYFKVYVYKQATPEQLKVVSDLISGWEQNRSGGLFDFGEFYGYLKRFVDEKNAYYDKLGVPAELRNFQPSIEKNINDYPLGNKFSKFKQNGFKSASHLELKYLSNLIPNWQFRPLHWESGEFYINYKKFIEQKDKEYDMLGIPKDQRDYRVKGEEVFEGYKLGRVLGKIKRGVITIPKAFDNLLSEIDPDWWKLRDRKGRIIENGKTKEETLKYWEDEEMKRLAENEAKEAQKAAAKTQTEAEKAAKKSQQTTQNAAPKTTKSQNVDPKAPKTKAYSKSKTPSTPEDTMEM